MLTDLYVYGCLCMRIFMYTDVYVCKSLLDGCLYMRMFMFTDLYVCGFLCIRIFMYADLYVYGCLYMRIFMYTDVYVHIDINPCQYATVHIDINPYQYATDVYVHIIVYMHITTSCLYPLSSSMNIDHTYTHACIHRDLEYRSYIRTHADTHKLYMPACIQILRTYMHKYAHTYTPTYTHTHIHTYIHTHIHTYIHTHTHTYIPRQSLGLLFQTATQIAQAA